MIERVAHTPGIQEERRFALRAVIEFRNDDREGEIAFVQPRDGFVHEREERAQDGPFLFLV